MNERMQRLFQRYQEETGTGEPISLRYVAQWAIQQGHWKPEPSALVRQCAEQFAIALREEFYTDPQGRRVRTKHAARLSTGENGEQQVFWVDIRTANRDIMMTSFQNRRRGILADCSQLKVDVDSYNENTNLGEAIQMVFNFEADLVEMEMMAQLTSV